MRWIGLALGCLAAFVLLALCVSAGLVPPALDAWPARSASLGPVASLYSDALPYASQIALAAALVLFLVRRRWAAALSLPFAYVVGEASVGGVKGLLSRPRPPGATALGGAFPSGHTAGATIECGLVLVTALAVLGAPRAWRIAGAVAWALLSALAGTARVLEGEHWPTDVVGGWLLGIAVVAAATWLAQQPMGRRRLKPDRRPGAAE